MNFFKRCFARLNTEYLIKNYLIGAVLGVFLWKMGMGGGTLGSKIYIIIATLLFPFSKLTFNDLRAVIFKNHVLILPMFISLAVSFIINSILFMGTWIFTPLGFIYLFILDKRDIKTIQNENNFESESLVMAGIKKIESGNYQDGISILNQVLENDNKNITAYNYRAHAKIAIEDYKGAISDCNLSLNCLKENPAALNNRGLAQYYMENFDEAKADYNAGLEILKTMKPDNNTRELEKILLGNIELLEEALNQN